MRLLFMERIGILPAILLLLLGTTACGYKIRSSVGYLPEGIQSLGIPTFRDLTNEFKVEQVFTRAVVEEFNRRTRAHIRSTDSGVDAVLLGEIQSVQSSPVTFDSRSFGSAYMVTVNVGARIVRLKDSKIIWQNSKVTFRERYALNSDVRDFFSEENPALERLAQSFAESLVGILLESQSIDTSEP